MSRRIAQLLAEPEHAVRKLIAKLEAKNGYPSHDVRHLAENIQKVRQKVAGIGLDPDDTTAEELYHALLLKFQSDSRRFDEHFSVNLKSYDAKITKAVDLVAGNLVLPERWVLKNQTAKSLLRQQPPKRIMRQLNYRSIDSFLKREDVSEIYLMLGSVESATWNKTFAKLVSALDSTAFELREVKIIALKSEKWGPDADVNVLFSNDCGSLGLEPSELLENASLMSLVILLLDSAAALTELPLSEIAKFSPAAAWWADTDGLIASLTGGEVSMNLRDTIENHILSSNFAERSLTSARQTFWQQLQSHYQNRLAPEEDLLANLVRAVKLPAGPTLQPAFEYEEALDG